MKLKVIAEIDTNNFYLPKEDTKELILKLDKEVGEVDFTLDVCRTLVQDMIKFGDSNKEEIIEYLFK